MSRIPAQSSDPQAVTKPTSGIAVKPSPPFRRLKTLQTDLNDHQKQMDARQNLEAEGKLYIPLYLKILSNNRQWQYLMTEREESVRRSIKEAEQRVRDAGHPGFTVKMS